MSTSQTVMIVLAFACTVALMFAAAFDISRVSKCEEAQRHLKTQHFTDAAEMLKANGVCQ